MADRLEVRLHGESIGWIARGARRERIELNGQTVLELTAHDHDAGKESEQTVRVDPATYLPVQTLSDGGGIKVKVDYGFLPPTPANMAELKAAIPPGFTRTATIQKVP